MALGKACLLFANLQYLLLQIYEDSFEVSYIKFVKHLLQIMEYYLSHFGLKSNFEELKMLLLTLKQGLLLFVNKCGESM